MLKTAPSINRCVLWYLLAIGSKSHAKRVESGMEISRNHSMRRGEMINQDLIYIMVY